MSIKSIYSIQNMVLHWLMARSTSIHQNIIIYRLFQIQFQMNNCCVVIHGRRAHSLMSNQTFTKINRLAVCFLKLRCFRWISFRMEHVGQQIKLLHFHKFSHRKASIQLHKSYSLPPTCRAYDKRQVKLLTTSAMKKKISKIVLENTKDVWFLALIGFFCFKRNFCFFIAMLRWNGLFFPNMDKNKTKPNKMKAKSSPRVTVSTQFQKWYFSLQFWRSIDRHRGAFQCSPTNLEIKSMELISIHWSSQISTVFTNLIWH